MSLFILAKSLEGSVARLLRAIDVYELPTKQRTLIENLKRELSDTKLEVRDYELAETRQFQLTNATKAKRYLSQANKHILAASEANLFGPADVAQLSAQIEQISNNLN